MNLRICLLCILLLLPAVALAHVGSPDVYYDGYAGPYHLLVTIRPPSVIPGLAEIAVRSPSPDVSRVEVVPMPLHGNDADLAPKPDVLDASRIDRGLFSGSLWIMLPGSWKLQVTVNGSSGPSEVAVPLTAVRTNSAQMGTGLKVLLSGAGLLLILGLLRIVHAANGEAELRRGEELAPGRNRQARVRMGIALALVISSLLAGNRWWNREASANASMTYRIPHLTAELQAENTLRLRLQNPGPSQSAKRLPAGWNTQTDDLVPDHGHLLHLFLIRMPEMNSFWHLHPVESDSGEFIAGLPSLPAGEYQIYADVVHRSGFPETEVGTISLPVVAGQPLSGDDSGSAELKTGDSICQLPGGYRMVWMRSSVPLPTKQPVIFRFRLEDSSGRPATQVENYMGMAGHAVFVGDDGKVFAHVHPEGSVSMAALAMAQTNPETSTDGMGQMSHGPASAEVSFPYGFPAAGDYHIFVQMKRSGQVQTGVFMAHVRE